MFAVNVVLIEIFNSELMRYFLCTSPYSSIIKLLSYYNVAITNNGLMNIIIRCPTNDPF